MNYYILIFVLASLSLGSRVFPWFISIENENTHRLEENMNILGISALVTLLIFNIKSFTVVSLLPLIISMIIITKTRNLGLSVISAIVISIFLGLI